MSFTFNWPRFSDQFHYDAIQMLNNALNKGNKPPIIADRIEVVELEMGTQPPELEIRDIGDLTVDQFRGIFRLTYSGDAHIVLKTKVQANPLNHKQPDIHLMTGSRGMLAAKEPLVVPMHLRLSNFKLNSYVVLVVSKQKGITLVFKTDPLQNVDINSTFDSIAVIQKFIQREIEGQLRQMFREDLPGIIHRLSQQWVKAKVEAPYLQKQPPPSVTRQRPLASDAMSEAASAVHSLPSTPMRQEAPPHLTRRAQSVVSLPRRARSVSGYSTTSSSKAKSTKSPSPPNPLESTTSVFPDLENFDPTYGLRPEGLPAKSTFRGFGNLFKPTRGLADLAEDEEDEEEDEDEEDYEEEEDGTASFDIVNWEYTVPPSSSIDEDTPRRPAAPPQSEYETIPAVGGGTITRPRIFHSQSLLQSPMGSPGRNSPIPFGKRRPSHLSHLSSLSGYSTPGGLFSNYSGGLHSAYHPPTDYFDSRFAQGPQSPPSLRSAPVFSGQRRNYTPDSEDTQQSGSTGFGGLSNSTAPTEPPYHDDEDDRFSYAHSTTRSPPHRARPPSRPHLTPIVQPIPSKPPTNAPTSRRASISAASEASSTAVDPDGFPTSSSPPTHHTLSHYVASHSASASVSGGANPSIILRPALNSSLSQLTTLSQTNHTLSPYTRAPQHFTVRSVPPSARATPHIHQGPVKAKRKRIFRLGGNNKGKGKDEDDMTNARLRGKHRPDGADFDESDMDRYFRTNEDGNQDYEPSDVFASPPVQPPRSLSPDVPDVFSENDGGPSSRSVSAQVRAALLQHRQQEQMYLRQRHSHRNQGLYPT